MTNNDSLVEITEVTELYYDTFANELVGKKDTYSPPERYIRYGTTDSPNEYIEIWKGRGNVEIVVRYTEKDVTEKQVTKKREQRAAEAGSSLSLLVEYLMSSTRWEDLLKYYKEGLA